MTERNEPMTPTSTTKVILYAAIGFCSGLAIMLCLGWWLLSVTTDIPGPLTGVFSLNG